MNLFDVCALTFLVGFVEGLVLLWVMRRIFLDVFQPKKKKFYGAYIFSPPPH